MAGDLGDKVFAEHLVEETVRRFGRIDILINNAAVPMHHPLYEISAEQAEDVMRINFLSCLWTTFAAIPHMLLQGESGGGATIRRWRQCAAGGRRPGRWWWRRRSGTLRWSART